MSHTPGPWQWGKDWDKIDRAGTMYSNDGENNEIEKYMTLGLCGPDGADVIPIRIDHYEVEYDGDPIKPEDRALICAAPDLLTALKLARKRLKDPSNMTIAEKNQITAAIVKAEGVL